MAETDSDQKDLFQVFSKDFLKHVRSKRMEKNKQLKPDEYLEEGITLPAILANELPKKLIGTPIKDLDKFYHDKETFMVINNRRTIFRFNASNALFMFTPINIVRSEAVYITVHSWFTNFMIAMVIGNFVINTPIAHYILLALFTAEMFIKIIARGFVINPFTYLRDIWNWLDFILNLLSYLPLVEMQMMSCLRTFRLLKEMKPKTVYPGIKNIGNVLRKSLWSLKCVLIFTFIILSIMSAFAVDSLKGTLKQRCVDDATLENSNFTGELTPYVRDYCGITRELSEKTSCEHNYSCVYIPEAPNPNYGYTNYDSFGFSLLSTSRIMLQDYWESLYHMIIITNGEHNVFYFAGVLGLGSYCLINLILATVVVTYSKMHSKVTLSQTQQERKIRQNINLPQKTQPQHTGANGHTIATDACNGESAHVTDFNEMETEDSKPVRRSKIYDFCCLWNCSSCCVKLQKYLSVVTNNPFFELAINLCIIICTIMLTTNHHGLTESWASTIYTTQYVFGWIFIIEATLKLLSWGPKKYFSNGWNIFSFISSLLLFLEIMIENLSCTLHFFSLRLLRLFIFVKAKPKFKILITSGKPNRTLMHLFFTLFIVINIFAAIGMCLFSVEYTVNAHRFPDGELPRYNFVSLHSSLFTLIRILSGEWIESMWDCVLVSGWICVPYVLSVIIICNFMLLNLFLAVVLCSSANDDISDISDDMKRLAEAIGRIISSLKSANIKKFLPRKANDATETLQLKTVTSDESQLESTEKTKSTQDTVPNKNLFPKCLPECCYVRIPCCASSKSPFWTCWAKCRNGAFKVVHNRYFEIFINVLIFINCIALMFKDEHLHREPTLKEILVYIHGIFAIMYSIEMVIRIMALGFKKYFSNFLWIVDFIVCLLYLEEFIHVMVWGSQIALFSSLISLRCLRFLKLLSRWENLRVILNTYRNSQKSIGYVVLFGFLFSLVMANIGVELFQGRFRKCAVEYGSLAILPINEVSNKNECLNKDFVWINTIINFDDVGNALLALFQVATLMGWLPTVNNAVDNRGFDMQPSREANIYLYYYFVYFLFTVFMIFIVFIGALADHFKEEKNKIIELTDAQRKLMNAIKKVANIKPTTAHKPKSPLQGLLRTFVTNTKFDMVINFLICLNVIIVAADHLDSTFEYRTARDLMNFIFIVTFSIECALKIYGLQRDYFKDRWNRFDLAIVLLAILNVLLKQFLHVTIFIKSVISLRIIRLVAITRYLRSIKLTRGIRILLIAFKKLLPFIVSIFVLLLHIIFIYAVLGMTFFMHVKHRLNMDRLFNFDTFGQSFILLFQLSTTAGWDSVLLFLGNEEDCKKGDENTLGNCGNFLIAAIYLVSYVIISFIILSLSIPATISSYVEASDEVDDGLTNDDFDEFFKVWQRFDSENSHYIAHSNMPELLNALEPPFRITEANESKIASMNFSICKGDKYHQVDILEALVEDIFVRKVNLEEEFPDDYEKTMRLKREEFSAKFIKKPWSKFYETKLNGVVEANNVTNTADNSIDTDGNYQLLQ